MFGSGRFSTLAVFCWIVSTIVITMIVRTKIVVAVVIRNNNRVTRIVVITVCCGGVLPCLFLRCPLFPVLEKMINSRSLDTCSVM